MVDKSVPPHHIKQSYCETRPKYRRGKKKTAVKVFTVNQESCYLIATNVQATRLEKDLASLCGTYGNVTSFKELKDYPKEFFTQAFLIQYADINSARTAKRHLDERYFYGAILHVFYAPEYETVDDVRSKLLQRRTSVMARIRSLEKEKLGIKSKYKSRKFQHKEKEKIKPVPSVTNEQPVAIWNSQPVFQDEIEQHQLVPQAQKNMRKNKQIVEELSSTSSTVKQSKEQSLNLKRKLMTQSCQIRNKAMKESEELNNKISELIRNNLSRNNTSIALNSQTKDLFLPRNIKKAIYNEYSNKKKNT